jgi:hypothetical protein
MEENRQQQGVSMTALVIEAITQTSMGHASTQEQLIFGETLRELVRLAKTEKIIEIKLDVMTAMGVRDEAKAVIEQAMVAAVQRLNGLLGGRSGASLH